MAPGHEHLAERIYETDRFTRPQRQSAARSPPCGFPARGLCGKPAFKMIGASGCSTPATSRAGAKSQRAGTRALQPGGGIFGSWEEAKPGHQARNASEKACLTTYTSTSILEGQNEQRADRHA